jgi:hypothetical protein
MQGTLLNPDHRLRFRHQQNDIGDEENGGKDSQGD